MSKFSYIPGIGAIEVEGTGAVKRAVVAKTFDDTTIASEAMRETGVQRELEMNKKINTALTDPGAWLTAKNKAIGDLAPELDQFYISKTYELMKEGYSNEQAIAKAKVYLKHRKDELMDKIETLYPTSITNMAHKKLKKKGEVK